MVIVIDSREQLPYEFKGFSVGTAKLDAGDYSIAGHESKVACERKSKADAYGCVGSGRKRFEAALGRLSVVQSPCIVIEADLADFATPPPYTKINAAQAVGSYISWSQKYRIPVFFCGGRAAAERVVIRWLAAYLRHLKEAA